MKGFTLIEVIVVVLIAAIIATIAVPSYLSSVKKTNRRAAQAALMEAVQLQQQYLADQRSYASTSADLHFSPPDSIENLYTFTFTTSDGPPPSFTATATPVAGGTQAGDVTLTINSVGAKTPDGHW